jgi:uncharacterized protein YegJ (DUF2314 family)
MRHSLVIALALAALCLAACDRGDDAAQTSDRPAPVVYAPQNDVEMNDAVARARKELATFEALTKSPMAGKTNFGVKVAIPHAGGEEHIWLGQPTFEADSVVGIVEDKPIYATGVTQGARVRVDRDAISDWMYMENGKLRGGYTMRVAIERLPEEQKAEQKKALGIEQ